jgi:hypothetical protein
MGQGFYYEKKFERKQLIYRTSNGLDTCLIASYDQYSKQLDTIVFEVEHPGFLPGAGSFLIFDAYLTEDKLVIVANQGGEIIDIVTFEKYQSKWKLSICTIIAKRRDKKSVLDIKIVDEETVTAIVGGKLLTYKINYKGKKSITIEN